MNTGVIKSAKNEKKGWRGNLVDEEGQLRNFEAADVESGYETVRPEDKVAFTPRTNAKGKPFATGIRLIEAAPRGGAQAEPETIVPQPPASKDRDKAPYTFVPVVTDHPGRPPLFPARFHDGTPRDDEPLFSGELRLTLTALTPLLVGQYRYPVTALLDGKPNTTTVQLPPPGGPRGRRADYQSKPAVEVPAEWGIGYPWQGERYWVEGDPAKPKKTKQVLEPLFIGEGDDMDGRRVLIPGSSIKGMLRHNLGALLNAPMERVQEQYFSYRPNLKSPKGETLECRPAVVEQVRGDSVTIRLLQRVGDAILVETPQDDGHRETIEKLLVPGRTLNPSALDGYDDDNARLLLKSGANPDLTDPHRALMYRDGIDGAGRLSEASVTTQARHFFRALVATRKIAQAKTLTIPPEVYTRYLSTQNELADLQYGHVARQDGIEDEEKRAISELIQGREFEPHQLIYVEIETSARPSVVVSCGHHYRYRWGYNDTVRTRLDPATGDRLPRPEVKPLPGEFLVDGQGRLSGARALFGMAEDLGGESGNAGIGKGSFSRLAGRIAINHAVEQLQPGRHKVRDRFLTTSHPRSAGRPALQRTLIPLAVLGQPRASAVEHYVEQTGIEEIPGATHTYGDLAGFGPPGAKLNGRKFYRHQTILNGDEALSTGQVTLGANGDADTARPGFVAEGPCEEFTAQSSLARFVSRVGTRFRFTLRYRDLALWELGALLVALNPDLLSGHDRQALPDDVREVVDRIAPKRHGEEPAFACKLGYGRPLGLGSIHIELAQARELDADLALQPAAVPMAQWQGAAIGAFLDQAAGYRLALAEWLEVCRFARRPQARYPSGGKDRTIYGYHTDLRQRHADDRRRRRTQERLNRGERVRAKLDD